MKIVEQSAELLAMTPDPMFFIERCGRVCYKSEEKLVCTNVQCSNGKIYYHTTGCTETCPDCASRARRFVQGIITRGHESVLEHASATFLLVTDRGMTHEIVRHRLASYSQESTRYCNYGNKGGEITVICPTFEGKHETDLWEEAMAKAESSYLGLTQAFKVQPQWARSVLPTCLKTEIAVTANFRQWRHMLSLRLGNTAGKAHPQIRQLFKLVLHKLMLTEAAPVFEEFVEIEV